MGAEHGPVTMPKSVELVGQRFTVELVDEHHEWLNGPHTDQPGVGAQKTAAQRIAIADDLGPDQTRDTLLHECLHGLCRVVNLIPDGRQEERVVSGLTPVLLDALRRNPGLVAFLVAP